MKDEATSERQALINSVKIDFDVEHFLKELAFERARADKMETAIREVLMTYPTSMPRFAFRQLEAALTR